MEILLIYSPTEVKMCLVATEESCLRSDLFKHVLTQILAVGEVCLVQFLSHHHFVGMGIQIHVQNPPQTACGDSKSNCMLRAERLGDWTIAALTISTFSGVLMDLRRPCASLLSVLPVASNCLTQDRIVFT